MTYTPANLALDNNASLYGGSSLLSSGGALTLNWNRPAVDSNHIGYFRFNDGQGNPTDDSANHNTGSFTSATNPTWTAGSVAASPVSTYAGNGAARFDTSANAYVSAGTVLAYEYTQPWTVMAAIRMNAKPASAAIIFTNVNQPPFPGYELWVNSQGELQVRIMSSAFSPGNTDNYIGVYGSTNVADNQWHAVAATYDGSGKVAGVHIYLDGVEQTQRTIESDTLAGHSIVSPTHGPFLIGNQTDWLNQFYMRGSIDQFSMSNVARSASFIAAHATPATIMPIDANTVLAYDFDQTSGATVYDQSPNHYDGTASSTAVFVSNGGASSTGSFNGLGSSSLYFDGSDAGVAFPSIAPYNLGSQFTLSFWADSLDSPAAGPLAQRITTNAPYPGYAFYPGYQNAMQWWDGSSFQNTGLVAPTGWHNYVIRFKSGTLDLFVDGTKVKTMTGVATPPATTMPLMIGDWPGLAGWHGYISTTTISSVARSDGYISQFATVYPASGVASLAAPGTASASGGGDLGQTVTLTNLAAAFTQPAGTNLEFRIGVGSTAAAATSDKLAQSFQPLTSSNALNKSGRYVDFDVRLDRGTDTIGATTPALTGVTLNYTTSAGTPSPSPTASATASPSPTASPTVSPTASPSSSPTPTRTPTATPSPTPAAPCSNATMTASPASPQTTGTVVTFTFAAQCGGTPQYEVWDETPSGAWQVLRGYATQNTYQWYTTGLPAGTYTFSVHVRNAGSTVAYDTYTHANFVLR